MCLDSHLELLICSHALLLHSCNGFGIFAQELELVLEAPIKAFAKADLFDVFECLVLWL